jgi:hypothetical protein
MDANGQTIYGESCRILSPIFARMTEGEYNHRGSKNSCLNNRRSLSIWNL